MNTIQDNASQDRLSERTAWWREARFGMFLHWGLYAIPSRDVWDYSVSSVPRETYEAYFSEFKAEDYDPRQWARIAREAGMKYAVLTAKHHDGFCLFDSALTEFKATRCPAGRDLVREFLDAFRAEGLRVGLYYSLLDWHHADYPHYGDSRHPQRANPAFKGAKHDFDRYLDYMHGQVRELCSGYGQLDILWLDFSYDDMSGEKWRATELVKMVRSLQPHVIINNRLEGAADGCGSIGTDHPSLFAGDFVTPERSIPPRGIADDAGRLLPWESCITTNDNWGYAGLDRNFKPAQMLVRKLVECVSKGGNMLLNVGPDPLGNFPPLCVEILAEIGRWMRRNGRSIYGCGPSAFPKPPWGWFTQNGSKLYAHLFEPAIGPHALPMLPEQVKAVRMLASGFELKPYTPWNVADPAYRGYTFVTLGVDVPYREEVCCRLPDEMDTVLQIELGQTT